MKRKSSLCSSQTYSSKSKKYGAVKTKVTQVNVTHYYPPLLMRMGLFGCLHLVIFNRGCYFRTQMYKLCHKLKTHGLLFNELLDLHFRSRVTLVIERWVRVWCVVMCSWITKSPSSDRPELSVVPSSRPPAYCNLLDWNQFANYLWPTHTRTPYLTLEMATFVKVVPLNRLQQRCISPHRYITCCV